MSDFRVFCRPDTPEPTRLHLSAEESHHLVVVNRARRGDPVVAFDGHGTEWTTTLTDDRKQAAVLEVIRRHQRAPLSGSITLGQALPKGASMDGIVRKATEIGLTQLVPLETERTQVHLGADRSERKIDKWRTAALEAAKQCGNPFLPEVTAVTRLEPFLTAVASNELKLVASLHPGAVSLRQAFAAYRTEHQRNPSSVAWLIGPEGDLTADEVAHAITHGFTPVTLGPLVLRCETAVAYALSVTRHELA
jgi:16S rRNA (uracil1498-N3)-methyltransferase